MKRNSQMRLVVTIFLLAVSVLLQTGCTATSDALELQEGEQSERTVSVSGAGEATVKPDVAILRLGVQTEAEDASAALSQNSARMQALVDVLKEAGVADKDIQTQTVRLQPRYERREEAGEPQVIGYTATNIAEVRASEIEMLGALLDAAVEAGGNRIERIRFEAEDADAFLDEAREAAWHDARHKAQQLAELSGSELGDVLTISESAHPPRPVVQSFEVEAAAASAPIEPGVQTIEVNIQVTWLLQ